MRRALYVKHRSTGSDRMGRFLGQSVKRVMTRPAVRLGGIDRLDLLHEGWLAYRESLQEGATQRVAFKRAETHMQTFVDRDLRARRPWVPDLEDYRKRLTPGQWRDLLALVGRVLGDQPTEYATMVAVFSGRSILEVARDRGVKVQTIRAARWSGIKQLRAALS